MKGIVFNLLEAVVTQHRGEDAWDDLLDLAEVDGAYTSLGSYPDEDMLALVAAASAAYGLSQRKVLRWFGREAMPLLAETYPDFFDKHVSTRPFLATLNSIIHPEVHKLYPGARCPHFELSSPAEDTIDMTYESPRGLCQLAHGFIEGASDHYGEEVAIEHLFCTHEGDEACVLRIAVA